MARELVVAARFGTAASLDAFLVAFVLPTFALNVIAGTFPSVVVPNYIRAVEVQGREAAQHMLGSIVSARSLSE
jgi:putative peptidoglycan lipid II flippase